MGLNKIRIHLLSPIACKSVSIWNITSAHLAKRKRKIKRLKRRETFYLPKVFVFFLFLFSSPFRDPRLSSINGSKFEFYNDDPPSMNCTIEDCIWACKCWHNELIQKNVHLQRTVQMEINFLLLLIPIRRLSMTSIVSLNTTTEYHVYFSVVSMKRASYCIINDEWFILCVLHFDSPSHRSW